MSDRYGTPTRPDDIPEAVWNSCWWAQALGLQEVASRHIMAAKAEEREACAKIADAQVNNTDALLSMPPKSSAAWNIANDIRSRT